MAQSGLGRESYISCEFSVFARASSSELRQSIFQADLFRLAEQRLRPSHLPAAHCGHSCRIEEFAFLRLALRPFQLALHFRIIMFRKRDDVALDMRDNGVQLALNHLVVHCLGFSIIPAVKLPVVDVENVPVALMPLTKKLPDKSRFTMEFAVFVLHNAKNFSYSVRALLLSLARTCARPRPRCARTT